MFGLNFPSNLDISFYSIIEDLFVVVMLYTFIKTILLSSLLELIWPTQFFNRRNSSGVVSFRLRTFTETVLKLRSTNLGVFSVILFFFI